MKLRNKLGTQLLGIWVGMTGLMQLVSIPIPALHTIMALLALASGILILLDR